MEKKDTYVIILYNILPHLSTALLDSDIKPKYTLKVLPYNQMLEYIKNSCWFFPIDGEINQNCYESYKFMLDSDTYIIGLGYREITKQQHDKYQYIIARSKNTNIYKNEYKLDIYFTDDIEKYKINRDHEFDIKRIYKKLNKNTYPKTLIERLIEYILCNDYSKSKLEIMNKDIRRLLNIQTI